MDRTVILSGALGSRSEANAQSKDPAVAASSRTASRHFNDVSAVLARFLPGDTFKLFMVAYLVFRLLVDFIKPYPHIFLGLGGIQWACLLVLLYYFRDVVRWLNLSRRKCECA
ncbi:MAG TPA: hypothetical protein VHW45_01970 [Candidatus Sulfotelmatobacter sp.]|nr:hypothetical protein [Candidatus Sulfotelmatobacter sp.]